MLKLREDDVKADKKWKELLSKTWNQTKGQKKKKEHFEGRSSRKVNSDATGN